MAYTAKQKLLASVLGLCAVALIADRTLLGPGEAAAAAPAAQSAAAAGGIPESVPIASAGAGPVTAEPLAARLDELAAQRGLEAERVRDAFVPSTAWVPVQSPTDVRVAAGSPAERFLRAHRLTAVMAGTASGFALVDGRSLVIGQRLDGFTLVEVTETSAVFESDRDRVVLELPETDG